MKYSPYLDLPRRPLREALAAYRDATYVNARVLGQKEFVRRQMTLRNLAVSAP